MTYVNPQVTHLKWVNPPLRKLKTEDEFIQTDVPQGEPSPKDATTYTYANTFNTMKKQLRKKKVSKKSRSERIADKTVSLSERLSIPRPK